MSDLALNLKTFPLQGGTAADAWWCLRGQGQPTKHHATGRSAPGALLSQDHSHFYFTALLFTASVCTVTDFVGTDPLLEHPSSLRMYAILPYQIVAGDSDGLIRSDTLSVHLP